MMGLYGVSVSFILVMVPSCSSSFFFFVVYIFSKFSPWAEVLQKQNLWHSLSIYSTSWKNLQKMYPNTRRELCSHSSQHHQESPFFKPSQWQPLNSSERAFFMRKYASSSGKFLVYEVTTWREWGNHRIFTWWLSCESRSAGWFSKNWVFFPAAAVADPVLS